MPSLFSTSIHGFPDLIQDLQDYAFHLFSREPAPHDQEVVSWVIAMRETGLPNFRKPSPLQPFHLPLVLDYMRRNALISHFPVLLPEFLVLDNNNSD